MKAWDIPVLEANMAEDRITAYQETLRNLSVAEAAAENVVNVIVHGAQHLQGEGWRETIIGNDPARERGGFPMGLSAGGNSRAPDDRETEGAYQPSRGEVAAYHEAGHAVAAYRLGQPGDI